MTAKATLSQLMAAWAEGERALAEVEFEPGQEAKARRVHIRSALADAGHGLAKSLRDQGRDADANMMDRCAVRHWSAAREELPSSEEELKKELANLPDHIKRKIK
jgi:hypothetical protein